MKGASSRSAAIFLSLLASSRALAYSYGTFYGWSADGSYYAASGSGTDEVPHPSLCLSDPKVPSPTWPKRVAAPEVDSGCTYLCNENDAECMPIAAVQKLVRPPRSVRAGPHGEIVQVSFAASRVRVMLTRQGENVGEATFETDKEGERPGVRQMFWRPDGGAAAVYVGNPEPRVPAPGWPAPRYLVMIDLPSARSGGVARADRAAAEAANARGMKLYRAKEYGGAAGEFRRAIVADAAYVLPHYNLACVAALGGDVAAAVGELKWLAANGDPLARAKLVKAKSDPDLRSVIDRPEVRAIVGAGGGGGAACESRCDGAQDRCEGDCADRMAAEYVRGCARACASQHDECTTACAAH